MITLQVSTALSKIGKQANRTMQHWAKRPVRNNWCVWWQIRVIEDERLRLLNLSQKNVSSGKLAQMPAELFCLQLGQLQVSLGRKLAASHSVSCCHQFPTDSYLIVRCKGNQDDVCSSYLLRGVETVHYRDKAEMLSNNVTLSCHDNQVKIHITILTI